MYSVDLQAGHESAVPSPPQVDVQPDASEIVASLKSTPPRVEFHEPNRNTFMHGSGSQSAGWDPQPTTPLYQFLPHSLSLLCCVMMNLADQARGGNCGHEFNQRPCREAKQRRVWNVCVGGMEVHGCGERGCGDWLENVRRTGPRIMPSVQQGAHPQ